MREALTAFAAVMGVVAHAPASASDQKVLNLYDHCMIHAAVDASRTDARNENIYRIAKAACVATRASVVRMHAADPKYLAAFNATDAQKARNYPSWIKGVRARRAAYLASRTARD